MIYMVKVFIIVAVPIFGLAGAVMLALLAWDEFSRYARARHKSERIIISSTGLRNRVIQTAPLSFPSS